MYCEIDMPPINRVLHNNETLDSSFKSSSWKVIEHLWSRKKLMAGCTWRLKPQNLCHGVNCIPTMYTCRLYNLIPQVPFANLWTTLHTNKQWHGMNKQTTTHKKEWHEQTNNHAQERMAWTGVNAAQARQWLNYQRIANIVSNEGWWQDKKCDLIMASLGQMWHLMIQMSIS